MYNTDLNLFSNHCEFFMMTITYFYMDLLNKPHYLYSYIICMYCVYYVHNSIWIL